MTLITFEQVELSKGQTWLYLTDNPRGGLMEEIAYFAVKKGLRVAIFSDHIVPDRFMESMRENIYFSNERMWELWENIIFHPKQATPMQSVYDTRSKVDLVMHAYTFQPADSPETKLHTISRLQDLTVHNKATIAFVPVFDPEKFMVENNMLVRHPDIITSVKDCKFQIRKQRDAQTAA